MLIFLLQLASHSLIVILSPTSSQVSLLNMTHWSHLSIHGLSHSLLMNSMVISSLMSCGWSSKLNVLHSYHGRSNGDSSSNHTSRSFCQIYLKIGHTAPACWHRFEQHYQPLNGSSTQAFVATTLTSIDPIWYPNTGANNHMTADFSNLNLNADYYTR